jgi:hypothetical protein
VAYHRVRILGDGQVLTVVHINDSEFARDWAYGELRRHRAWQRDALWAATLESGCLFVDPLELAPDVFLPDGQMHEGLVLDPGLLNDPNIDLNTMFGLK